MGHVPTTRGHSSITTREAQLAYFISFPGDMVWLDSKFGYTSFDCTVLPLQAPCACVPAILVLRDGIGAASIVRFRSWPWLQACLGRSGKEDGGHQM